MPDEFKILIVDDDDMFRGIMESLFENSGTVLTASGGFEAIEIIKQNPVNVVFCDMNMPKGSGLELLDWIRASDHFQKLPVILVTGHSSLTPEGAIAKGAFAVVSKPFRMKALLDILAKIKGG